MGTDNQASKEIVHAYAGWPGKAMCLGADTPLGTHSNTSWAEVTCVRCWIDHLIGDGKRDNIIVPMCIARDVQAALKAENEPCPAHSHPGCPHCHPDKTVPQLNEQYAAAVESGAWKEYCDGLAKILGASQPPGAFKPGDSVEWTTRLKQEMRGTVETVQPAVTHYVVRVDQYMRVILDETELRHAVTTPGEQS